MTSSAEMGNRPLVEDPYGAVGFFARHNQHEQDLIKVQVNRKHNETRQDNDQPGRQVSLRLATQQAGYQRSKKTSIFLDRFILHGLQEKVSARLGWFVEFHLRGLRENALAQLGWRVKFYWDGVRQKVFAWLGWPVDLYIILNRR